MTDDAYQGDPLQALTDALDRFLGGPWLDGTFTIDMAKAQASEEARKAGYRKSAAQREKDRENRGGRIKRTFDTIPGYRAIPDEELSHGIKYRRGLSLKAAEARRKARKPHTVIRHLKDDFVDAVATRDALRLEGPYWRDRKWLKARLHKVKERPDIKEAGEKLAGIRNKRLRNHGYETQDWFMNTACDIKEIIAEGGNPGFDPLP